ncbi:MAG: nitric oxide reductase NorD protein [Blastocatellia bacterium]|nr:nitric oxide reductase NorD protein [Blastocatellia bacterium]
MGEQVDSKVNARVNRLSHALTQVVLTAQSTTDPMSDELQNENLSDPFAAEIDERLRSIKSPAERRTLAGLLREIVRLPIEHTRAALESSAAIAAVSLRASIEFLRTAPSVAQVLGPTELRAWAELGRRLTMSDVENGVSFFTAGSGEFANVPATARPFVFQVCARQMILSAQTAAETFRDAPMLAEKIKDGELLRSVYEVAAEISRRSAKHSADFLRATPVVIHHLNTFSGGLLPADSQSQAGSSPPLNGEITRAAINMASAFAERAGGIAADAWAALPAAIDRLNVEAALKLMQRATSFLERGGAASLHVLIAGGEILRTLPECFDDWIDLLWAVASHGNAGLVAFVRSSPAFFQTIANRKDPLNANALAHRVISLTREVAQIDSEAALACLRSSAKALHTVSIEQFESWARAGLIVGDMRARRSYYALETRSSNEALREGGAGVSLESVQLLLRLYVEGLTGRSVEIAPLAAVPVESRIGDGRTIHLPAVVTEFGDEELDFRLYKVLAAHAAGQIEFETYARDTVELRAAYSALSEIYDPANQGAFALGGYIEDITGRDAGEPQAGMPALPAAVDYRHALSLFPIPPLARRIFGTLENGRVDRRLRKAYRGLARDLDLIRDHLRARRPNIVDLPATLVPFELLFQITLLAGARDDARDFYGQIVSELETIVAEYLSNPLTTTVADTLMATSRVYSLFQSIALEDSEQKVEVPDELDQEDDSKMSEEMLAEREANRQPRRRDARELFNAWNTEADGEFDELEGSEAWSEGEVPEQGLEAGEVAYNYDEWDRELVDHRVGWCRVVEKKVKRGERAFVDDTRERYKGIVSSIRHQFQLMKPEDLARVTNEIDGDDYDLNAVVDFFIDRRADGQQSDRIYTRRLRRRRDVAVSFLLDQSSSTARTIGRHPLQPYTHPGRRIIEIEKEGLVLMSEALEAVGDRYAINGFTSEGRRNVKFYVLKDFGEHYSDEVMQRIGGITYQNNTRLGAAIRHAAAKLSKQDARTRLLIVLSDGRPYDHDYGDARYAREDTREALRQAKTLGITPFCITIDRESEAELRDLYGDVGYTIIDDVLTLPERLPGIYRRLTT